jgi:hypothetical protein
MQSFTTMEGTFEAFESHSILLVSIVFLALYLIKGFIDQWQGYPNVGKSRLLTLLPWETPTRLCLDKWATKGYQMVRNLTPGSEPLNETDKHQHHKNTGGKPFYMRIYGLRMLVMPPNYLDALKSADHHTLNFAQSLSDVSVLQK